MSGSWVDRPSWIIGRRVGPGRAVRPLIEPSIAVVGIVRTLIALASLTADRTVEVEGPAAADLIHHSP